MSVSTPRSGVPAPMARVLKRVAGVEPEECATVLAAFLLLFFVLGSYFAVRPVRESLGISIGRDRVADLWTYTAALSILIVPLYGALVGRVRRSVFLPCIYAAVAIALAATGVLLRIEESDLGVAQAFYVGISVVNLLLVSVFWSFMLESFDSGQAKRLFGLIAAGGTAGALTGPAVASLTVESIGNSGVLFVGAAGFLAAIVCQLALVAVHGRADVPSGAAPPSERALGGNPFAGVMIVLRSPYLLMLSLFILLLSAVNTFVYFEQLRLVEQAVSSSTGRTQVFARIDFVVQALTILSQLFLTGRIATRVGVTALLMMVPIAMIGGFVWLAIVNSLLVVGIVQIVRRWGEYAFVRPGREMLFSRLDTETKYKAKNLIDVPIYRLADAVGAQVKAALEAAGLSAAGTAALGALIAAGWAVNGRWLGRRFDRG